MTLNARRSPLRKFALAVVATATVVGGLGLAATAAQAATPNTPAQQWGVNGRVNIILPVGNQIVIGGQFTDVVDTAGNSYPANNIAVINETTGAADLTWQGNVNNDVTALAQYGGILYVGGTFTKADGVPASHLAALNLANGSLYTSWTPGADGPVDALAVAPDGSEVYASGYFQNITDSTGTYARPYIAKLDPTYGTLDQAWTPVPSDRVRGLAVSPDGTELYFAGDFKKVNNNSSERIVAEVSTSDPAVLAPFRASPTNNTNYAQVFDIAVDSTAVYTAVGGSGGACTAMDPVTGARIWSKHANGNMQSVRVLNGYVYCGGHFGGSSSFDGLPRQKIAIVTEAAPYTTTSFAPNVNSPLGVWSVGVDQYHLFLGGDFDSVAGVPTQHFADFIDTTIQTAPLAPTLSATSGDSVVTLQWNPPSSDGGSAIKTYNVYRRLDAGGVYGKKLATVKGSTSYADTTVVDGTLYDYVVTATNSLGEGAQSNEVQGAPVQFTQSAPSAPQNFTATSGTGSDALTWATPSSNGNSPITGYNIYRGTSSGGETLLTSVSPTTMSYTDGAIVAGTQYFYDVTAVNAIGESVPSTEQTATPVAGVPGPVVLTGAASPGVIQLTWAYPASDGGSPVTKYVVVRDGVRYATVTAPTLTYNDTAVNPGDQHTYQVRAVNALGSGGYSNKVVITAQ